jgi:hypothetical protein
LAAPYKNFDSRSLNDDDDDDDDDSDRESQPG